jgi:methionine synthase I (cobalamin-dependent)
MYDGAMGTMIQKKGKWLDEAAFRGKEMQLYVYVHAEDATSRIFLNTVE